MLDQRDAFIALGLQCNTQSTIAFFERLGPKLIIHAAQQRDSSAVVISVDAPRVASLKGARVQGSLLFGPSPTEVSKSSTSPISLGFDSDSRLHTITSRLDIEPGPTRDALRKGDPVSICQNGPFCIRVAIGRPSGNVNRFVRFPVPVVKSDVTVRIARKSAYVEVCVQVKTLVADSEQDNAMTMFPYHTKALANFLA